MMDRWPSRPPRPPPGSTGPTWAPALLMDADGPAGRGGAHSRPAPSRSPARPGALELRRPQGRGRAAAHVEGAQERLRRGGAHLPQLHGGGRRHPALRDRAGCCARSRRMASGRRACGWPTSSTPATATSTRWCSTTPATRGEEERAARPGRRHPALCVRLRRLHHRRARGGRREGGLHGRHVRARADLETMELVRCAFDPEARFNPGKVFPTPRLCGEKPGPGGVEHPAEVAGRGGAMVTRAASRPRPTTPSWAWSRARSSSRPRSRRRPRRCGPARRDRLARRLRGRRHRPRRWARRPSRLDVVLRTGGALPPRGALARPTRSSWPRPA